MVVLLLHESSKGKNYVKYNSEESLYLVIIGGFFGDEDVTQ